MGWDGNERSAAMFEISRQEPGESLRATVGDKETG